MKKKHYIRNENLSLKSAKLILEDIHLLELSAECIEQIIKCRSYLDEKLSNTEELFYGINTGFGSLCDVKISMDEISQLQKNLVMSHACGAGEEVPQEIVRLMLFLKILSLAKGYSGIRLETTDALIHMYNHHITPVVFQQGSLGASGDLAPLAHLSLPLLGLGTVYFNEDKLTTDQLPEEVKLNLDSLESKEGLALLNGTQFSTAYGIWALINIERLRDAADMIAAISLEAFNCSMSPFDPKLQEIRKQKGQIESAANVRNWLDGRTFDERKKDSVQDPYAFRCIPQVHGATRVAIDHAREIFEAEMNSVTDNPNIFCEEDEILSGGNFHAQALALPLDYLGIAISELASISERRTYQLISGQRGLPDFLLKDPGLHSGMMIPQYTAASIVSQNKQLCTPASVDSIVSSNGQEDHVSMAANAATKLYRIVKNVETVLAIELMVATQALEFRRPYKASQSLEKVVEAYRKVVPKLTEDRVLQPDIQNSVKFLRSFIAADFLTG